MAELNVIMEDTENQIKENTASDYHVAHFDADR